MNTFLYGINSLSSFITGTAYPGNTLTSTRNGQWYLNGSAIIGETGKILNLSYSLYSPGDVITQLKTSNALTVPSYDSEANSYISAVISAGSDFGATSSARINNKWRVNDLVLGLKLDASPNAGVTNWDAIKAFGLLCGPTSLTGALVPLKGSSPTNNNFVSGDYNQLTGLKGNGSTKSLLTNRTLNSDPQNNKHLSVGISERSTAAIASYIGTINENGSSSIVGYPTALDLEIRSSSNSASVETNGLTTLGVVGISRNSSTAVILGKAGTLVTKTLSSNGNATRNVSVFLRTGEANYWNNARLYSYTQGEAVDLTSLHTRLNTYKTALV